MTVNRAVKLAIALRTRLVESGIPDKEVKRLMDTLINNDDVLSILRKGKDSVVDVLAKDISDAYLHSNKVFSDMSKADGHEHDPDVSFRAIQTFWMGMRFFHEPEQSIGY